MVGGGASRTVRGNWKEDLTFCSRFVLEAFVVLGTGWKVEIPGFVWRENHWWLTKKQVIWDRRDKIGNLKAEDHNEKAEIDNWVWYTADVHLEIFAKFWSHKEQEHKTLNGIPLKKTGIFLQDNPLPLQGKKKKKKDLGEQTNS